MNGLVKRRVILVVIVVRFMIIDNEMIVIIIVGLLLLDRIYCCVVRVAMMQLDEIETGAERLRDECGRANLRVVCCIGQYRCRWWWA